MSSDSDARRLLASCDESQRGAITAREKPLLVVASAGSGKTRVLTRRIAWMVLQGEILPEHVLALTFTRKAATELRDRLGQLGLSGSITAGTFHALALAQLRQRALDESRPLPVILDSKARILGSIVPDRPQFAAPTRRPINRRETISVIAGEIEWAKARGIAPERYGEEASRLQRSPSVELSFIDSVYASYEVEKRKRRVLDFDDLLSELTVAMRSDPNFAAAQRWRFRHFFVDELQDASPVQLALLDEWIGDRPDLFAVGDPRQAIYGWNGADTSAIDTFSTRHPNATVLHLDVNYRSTPQVVAIAASALTRAERRLCPAPRPDGHVPSVTAYADDFEEADEIARELRRAHGPGRRWSDCAVLARTNAQLRLFEEALRTAGIPARVGDARRFLAAPEIRTALARLDRCNTVSNFVTWLDDVASEIASNDSSDGGLPEFDLVDEVIDREANAVQPSNDRRDLALLHRLAQEYAELDSHPTGPGCQVYLRESLRSDPLARSGDAVDLLTFHRAKGLEWPLVWVTGLEDGFVPIGFAKSALAVAEERRLLYVALSRAEDELRCSWARTRHFGQRVMDRQPSPWLMGIEQALHVLRREDRPSADVAAQALAESRAALARGRES